MGTKCNKLKIYDTNTHKLSDVTQLVNESDGQNGAGNSPHGVYSIQMNPSRNLLATLGQTGKDIAVYRVPNLEPVCVGQKSHSEGILDLCWLDDEFVVSGGMDRKLSLWRIDDFRPRNTTDVDNPEDSYEIVSPLRVKKCVGADKLRAVIYNEKRQEIVTLSTNAFIHLWDPIKFYQKMSRKLPHAMENVCLTQKADYSVYAVGSKSHFTLLDPRTLQYVKKVCLVLIKLFNT